MRGGKDVGAEAIVQIERGCEWAVLFSGSYFAQALASLVWSRWVVTAQRIYRAALVSNIMAVSGKEEKPRSQRSLKREKTDQDDYEEAERKRRLRILRRRKTNPDFHFVTDWITVWSSGNTAVAVGPPKIEQGLSCILVSPNAKWVKQQCFHHETWQQLENGYIAETIKKLRDIVRGYKRNPLDVGAAGLRDDHSSEETASETEAVRPNRHREKARWLTIPVNDDDNKLTVLVKRGSGIYIQYTGDAIILICSLVHDTRRKSEDEASPEHANLLLAVDEDKVTYNPTKKAYKVYHRLKSGLWLNKYFDVQGGDATMTLALARRYWNQCDTSGKERYLAGIL